MEIVTIHNVGSEGVNRDQPPHTLAPEVWTRAENIRFTRKGANNIAGESAVFGTPLIAPVFVMAVPTASIAYWIYTSKTKAYVYEGGVHTNITRQTASVDVDYTTVNNEDWGGTLLGGVAVLNNAADVPQYWSDYNPSQKLQALPNWPADLRAKQVKAFGQYLVALNLVDGSTSLPHTIQWSHRANPGAVPGSWDYADPEVDAGRRELTDVQGGPIFDGLMLGNAMIIYKASSFHTMRYIGGNDIFTTDLVLASSGLLAPKCACNIRDGRQQFAVTDSDIVVHSGQKDAESVIEDKLKDYLFDNIDTTYKSKAFTFDNPRYSEAWFAFPLVGSSEVNQAAIFNYRKNTWSFRDFSPVAVEYGLIAPQIVETWDSSSTPWDLRTEPWSNVGQRGLLLCNPTQTELQRLDSGRLINGVVPTAVLERTGLAIVGRDRRGEPKVDYRVVKQVNRITPKLRGTAVVSVEVGVQDDFNDDVVWSAASEFRIGVDRYIDFDDPPSGKLIAVRFSSTTEDTWQLEGYDLEIALLGNLGDENG